MRTNKHEWELNDEERKRPVISKYRRLLDYPCSHYYGLTRFLTRFLFDTFYLLA